MLDFAVDVHGKTGIRAAWNFFCAREVPLEEAPEHPDFEQLFTTWLLFDWQKSGSAARYSTRSWPPRPPAARFLEERGLGLTPVEERLVRAALAAPLSFAVVERVSPGVSLDLRDILTGARHTVLDEEASQSAQPGHIVFARVVTVDAVSMLLGAGYWLIPPAWHNYLIDVRQQWAGQATTLPADEVRRRHADLVDVYGGIVERLRNPPPPKLQNTDGDPLAPTKLQFALRCTPQEAVQRLAPLASGRDSDDLLEPAEKAPDGSAVYEVPWLVPGNKVHSEWDNTILGTMRLRGEHLEAEVNSERRARRLRKEIERRLRDRVLFLKQETTSAEAMLGDRGLEGVVPGEHDRGREAARLEREALLQHPEVRARMREMAERHWKAWMDQPIPTLGGQTPRQAARTPLGRERLEALLTDYETHDPIGDPALRADVARLRQELGLLSE